MAIDANKRYKLTGAQIQELATRLVGAEALQPLTGSSAPTLATVGVIGQLYVQDDGTVYILKDIEEDSGDESGALAEYIWEEFGAGTEYTAGDGIDITNDIISATNTGKAKVLTTADYNYHSSGSTDNGIAPWLLESGTYAMAPGMGIYYQYNSSLVTTNATTSTILVVSSWKESITKYGASYLVSKRSSTGNDYNTIAFFRYSYTNGAEACPSVELYQSENSLTSTSTSVPLAANQGKVLKDLVDSLVIRASGAPTTSTAGTVGKLYEDTTNGKLYICTAVSGNTYTWEEVGESTTYTAGDGISISAQDVISATNTGKAKILTTADYNWPATGTKTAVALWLLDDGIYYAPDGVAIRRTSTTQGWTEATYIITQGSTNTAIVTMGSSGVYHESANRTTGAQVKAQSILVKKSEIIDNLTSNYTDQPLSANQGKVLNERIGDLTTLETTAKTSAVAAINELASTVDDIEPQSGSGAPTSSTEGTIGQTYVDTSTGDIYYLSEIIEESGEPDSYVWNKITVGPGITELTSADYNYPTANPRGIAVWLLDEGIYKITDAEVWAMPGGASDFRNWVIIVAKKPTVASGTGDGTIAFFPEGYNAYIRDGYLTDGSSSTYYGLAPTVVQSTGTSTTDVMSQNATTSMVFADPATMNNVKIGRNAGATGYYSIALGYQANAQGNNNVAIGRNANVDPLATNAVALGEYSLATAKGQFDISALGNVSSTEGYNNSAYRLLTGLYDPQSAHDAATKGYVDTAVGGITVPTAVSQLANDSGYQTSSDVNSAIAAAVADITSFSYEVVASLPAYGEKGVIYLVASEDSGDPSNVYEEYLWIEDDESGESGPSGYFELIGTTAIDLSGYATTTALAEAIGKAHIITTDDYNYDSNTKVAAWLLSDGVYVVKATPTLYLSQATSVANATIIKGTNSWGTPYAIGISNSGYGTDVKTYNLTNDGSSYGWKGILDSSSIRSNLTTTVNGYALDAEQGKILNDKITGLIVKQSSAPTSATTGTVGQIYENTTTGKLYICTEVVEESGEPTSYVWTEVGDGPTVVQTTGSSTTDVMSQNAVTTALASAGPTVVQTPGGSTSTVMSQATVTGMIFQDPLIRNKVQIATSSTASGDCSVGIGYSATSTGDGAVALGAGARAMTQGEVNIGSNFTTDYGYNNSNYRLLTGLYDPQTAHDAATKGYVDTKIGDIETILARLTTGSGIEEES